MTQEKEPKEITGIWGERIRSIPIYWKDGTFDDCLDIPLDYPYSSTEWDSIFAVYIDLLQHKQRWIRKAAIARLRNALNSESLQVSNCEDYKPKPIAERMKVIFEAVTSQTAVTSDVFEDFFHQFSHLIKKEPYRSLVLQWLNQLSETQERQFPSDEAILAARILWERGLNSLFPLISNEYEIAISRIDGYLCGLSELCHGCNYVPLYKAIACFQVTSDLPEDIQTTLLVMSFEYKYSISRLKQSTECSKFQLIDNWETILHSSLEQWIFKRMFEGSVQSNQYLFSAKGNIANQLVWLIREAIESEELEVWRFQIGCGCDYIWGFNNESYAFKAEDKLFILTFGWSD